MSSIKNKNVLITGGAAGIGKIIGRIALEKGANLIIWDINEILLGQTVAEFKSKFTRVSGYTVDVSDINQIHEYGSKMLKEHGNIDILINNAGIVVGKYFNDHSIDEIQKTMSVNAMAPMFLTLEFLPKMMENNQGHICNIASSAGLISNPKMSVYVSSKWALCGWSDSLRLEMTQMGKNIKVTTVTPYYIDTGMFDGVKSLIPILNPEKVARKIVKGIEHNKILVSMPWPVWLVRLGQAIFPIRFFDWFIGDVMGVYHTMSNFRGH